MVSNENIYNILLIHITVKSKYLLSLQTGSLSHHQSAVKCYLDLREKCIIE